MLLTVAQDGTKGETGCRGVAIATPVLQTAGAFVDECDQIERLIAESSNPQLSRGRREKAQEMVLKRVQNLQKLGYRLPRPAWRPENE